MRAAVLASALVIASASASAGCDRAPASPPPPSPPAPRPPPGFVTPRPAPAPPTIAVPPVTACPNGLPVPPRYAAHLFPACAASQFADGRFLMPSTCGTDCPRPCAVTCGGDRFVISYDASGAWLATMPEGMTRSNDRAAVDPLAGITIRRDAQGEIAAITSPTWTSTYAYDTSHRLIQEHQEGKDFRDDYRYRYDGDHVVARTGGPCRWDYHYDAAGRLHEIVSTSPTDHRANVTISYRYDAQGRQTNQDMVDLDGNGSACSYDYRCAR